MPRYDYECQACGRQTEVMHGIYDPRPTTCEACGGKLRKLMSSPAIVFKGSGWAKKDARTAAPAGAKAKASEEGSGSNATDDSAKSDSSSASEAKPSKDQKSGSSAGKKSVDGGGPDTGSTKASSAATSGSAGD